MRITTLTSAVLLLFATASGADKNIQSVSLESVQSLVAPLTIADIERTFGPAAQGHGPYYWYIDQSNKNAELWFWWQPAVIPPSNTSEQKLAYVTLSPVNFEGQQIFVWPAPSIGLNVPEVLRKLYKEFK